MSKIILDEKTRFPLISFDEIPLTVFLLPITNIQLELFLSEVIDLRFDANWYQTKVLNDKDNPRISINNVTQENVSHHLATNILVGEARRIANWFGHFEGQIYDLPTKKEWRVIYKAANKQKPLSLDSQFPDDIDARAKTLLKGLYNAQKPQYLSDQMLLSTNRIVEYVYQDDTRHICEITGQNPENFTPLRQPQQEIGYRKANLTFRFVRRSL